MQKAKQQPQPISKPAPMVRAAVTRIVKHAARVNGGQIVAKSFAARADAVVQQREAVKLSVVKPAGISGRARLAVQGQAAHARAGKAGRTGS